MAQNIFRSIIPDEYCKYQIRETLLFSKINTLDENKTRERYRVQAALNELKESGFIKGYKVLEGKNSFVYHIDKYSKKKSKNIKGKYGGGGKRKFKGG